MTKKVPLPDYSSVLTVVKQRIVHAQTSAARAVNRELVLLYWDIGRSIRPSSRLPDGAIRSWNGLPPPIPACPRREEYFVDLLFYQRFLKALVDVDLKIGSFEPEHSCKMAVYLNLLNEKERGPGDQPSSSSGVNSSNEAPKLKLDEEVHMIKAWDADGHVSESEVTFSDKYWDAKLKDRKPSIIETGPDGPLYWMIDTRSFPVRSGPHQQAGFPLSKNGLPAKVTPGISPHDPVESAEMRSVKARLEQLDRENTAVQVIYPTMFLSYPITYDRELAVAMMRAYNSWIADLTSTCPERLKWVTIIDPVDPQASVREIERGKKLGAVGVMLLGVTGDVRIDDAPMEPIWAAANDTGLPVAVHTGHSFRALGEVNDTHHDKTAISFWLTVQFAFHRVISKGIADRYPNLRIAFLEAGCSWVPALVERIEEYSGFPGARAGVDFHRGYTGKLLPKEYIERGQIYFGFEVDEKLLPFAIEEFGDQCWVYGSDIPHGDRLYGAVDVFLARKDISEDSKRKLLVDNTARFYGLQKLPT